MRIPVLMLLAVGVSAPAMAIDRTGYQSIVARDYATAERHILAERRIFPDRPELMLNLAAVYRETGRDAQARALYADVLTHPAVAMDLPSGAVASSHDLATRALARMSPQVATR